MEVSGKQKFGIVTVILVVLIAIRVALIWHSNHEAAKPAPAPTATAVPADAYVAPPKLHAYDLASAKQGLEGKTIWVAAGDQLDYFTAQGATVNWAHPLGKLPPLDPPPIPHVVKTPAPPPLIQQGNVTLPTKGTPTSSPIF